MLHPLYYRIAAVIFLLHSVTACERQSPPYYELTTSKSFAEVIQDIEFVITEYNFRITNRMHIGKAIRERGADGFPENEVILFCNLSMAEDMLKQAPAYINYCPYKIAVAVINDKIVLSTPLLPDNSGNESLDKIAKKINKILRTMIEYGASEDPFQFDINS